MRRTGDGQDYNRCCRRRRRGTQDSACFQGLDYSLQAAFASYVIRSENEPEGFHGNLQASRQLPLCDFFLMQTGFGPIAFGVN